MVRLRTCDPRDALAAQIHKSYQEYVRTVRGQEANEHHLASRHRPHSADPGHGPRGLRESIWWQLADRALRDNVDVPTLLHLLGTLHKGKICINPEDILRFKVKSAERQLATRRQQGIDKVDHRTRVELFSALMVCEDLAKQVARARRTGEAVDEYAILTKVIRDRNLNLSPLIRVYLAYYFGLQHLAADYLPEAIEQYRSAPDSYHAVLGYVLPAEFRSAARQPLASR